MFIKGLLGFKRDKKRFAIHRLIQADCFWKVSIKVHSDFAVLSLEESA